MRDKLLVVFCCARLFAIAQPPQAETITKPLSQKEKKKRDEKLRRELESPYKIWLNVDVAYIITDEERRAFNGLSNDAERESFIEQFWLRRDPTPDTEENEFKEEHYRRIAYANERFASGIPGWKTDRGRTYIVYGPPDEIESHPSGGTYQLPQDQGGQSQAFPFETWRYRFIQGIGTNVVFEFVDQTMSGEYHITIDPNEEKRTGAHSDVSTAANHGFNVDARRIHSIGTAEQMGTRTCHQIHRPRSPGNHQRSLQTRCPCRFGPISSR